MKKFFALMLIALVLVSASAVTAFAEDVPSAIERYYLNDSGTADYPDWFCGWWSWEDHDDPSAHNVYVEIGLTADAPENIRDELYSLFPFMNVRFKEQKYSHNLLQTALEMAEERSNGWFDGWIYVPDNVVILSTSHVTDRLDTLPDEIAAELGVDGDIFRIYIEEPVPDAIATPAEPVTSPPTGDPTTILCLMLSALASVGICLIKKEK